MNVNNIIEISDMREKNDLTIVSMKRMSISFKHKMLSLIALKFLKHVQISEQGILTSVKTDSEMKTSHSTPAKMINEVKMSSVQQLLILSSEDCTVDCRAQDLKVLK
ncbi:hypothetical protein BDFG_02142 [Blastomyces dermatitidis ATCC 26199]|nr:hypothetical protein BDFG_02142 [Blastomyces dermatitidis ATCC 26199]